MAWNRLRLARTTEALRAATTYMLGELIVPTDGANANRPFLGDGATAGGRALAFKDESVIGAGSVINSAYAEVTAYSTTAATIPMDDTPPQNTEGLQLISVSITPTSATSKIRVRFVGLFSHSASEHIVTALFVSGNANSLRSTYVRTVGANTAAQSHLEFEHAPGTTSALTYSIRIGTFAGTIYVNGNSTGRVFGGVAGAVLVAEEIKA